MRKKILTGILIAATAILAQEIIKEITAKTPEELKIEALLRNGFDTSTVDVIYKLGDNNSYKDGDVIEYLDRMQSGDTLPYSEHMLKVYHPKPIPRSQIAYIRDTLMNKDYSYINSKGNFVDSLVRSPYKIDVTALCIAEKVDKEDLYDGSKTDIVEDKAIDLKTIVIQKTGKELDYTTSEVKDVNLISSGTYTVGSGGDYATLALAEADVDVKLTDNLTFNIISAYSGTATVNFNDTLNGYTLTINSNLPHKGNPLSGYIISVAHNSHGLRTTFPVTTLGGTFEAKNLYYKRTTAATNSGRFLISITAAAVDTTIIYKIHDNLMDGNGLIGSGFTESGTEGNYVYIWNNIVWDCPKNNCRGINTATAAITKTHLYENNTVYACSTNYVGSASFNGILRNNASFAAIDGSYLTLSGATGYNNSSHDSTAKDANWATGSGNQVVKLSTAECISVSDANANFLQLISTGTIKTLGIAPTIAGNTKGIRTNDRPGIDGSYSIGADEYDLNTTVPLGCGMAVNLHKDSLPSPYFVQANHAWYFNDTSATGVVTDSGSDANAHGQLKNGVKLVTGFNRIAKACSLDGVDDSIVVTSNLPWDTNSSAMTISFRIKVVSTAISGAILGLGEVDGTTNYSYVYYRGAVDSNCIFYWRLNGGTSIFGRFKISNPLNWNRITWVYDSTQSTNATRLIAMLNGVQQTLTFSGTIPTKINDFNAFYIGAVPTQGASFKGMLDEIRISSNVRSALVRRTNLFDSIETVRLDTLRNGSKLAKFTIYGQQADSLFVFKNAGDSLKFYTKISQNIADTFLNISSVFNKDTVYEDTTFDTTGISQGKRIAKKDSMRIESKGDVPDTINVLTSNQQFGRAATQTQYRVYFRNITQRTYDYDTLFYSFDSTYRDTTLDSNCLSLDTLQIIHGDTLEIDSILDVDTTFDYKIIYLIFQIDTILPTIDTTVDACLDTIVLTISACNGDTTAIDTIHHQTCDTDKDGIYKNKAYKNRIYNHGVYLNGVYIREDDF